MTDGAKTKEHKIMASKTLNKIVAQIESLCDAKIASANAASNAGLAKKWAAVKVDLVKAGPVFEEFKIDPKKMLANAIYAAQKQGKTMRSAALGVNVMDRFTNTVLHNARQTGGTISNALQNASLSKFIEGEFGADLDRRLVAHSTTASTQASSTRKALEGLGLCSVADRVMNLTLDNPLGRRLLEIVDGKLEAKEEEVAPVVTKDEEMIGETVFEMDPAAEAEIREMEGSHS